jgi:short subunit dehydrogenase-like uncharacterized protein
MLNNSFLLYGANGYTGELIARYATEYNLKPILAGRRKEVIEPLALKYNLPYLVFDLNDHDALKAALQKVSLVVHAAGPFEFTAKQMVEACLETQTHYIDINGDIAVFELLKSYDAKAKQKGIMIMPGAGFDVVPTDCLSLFLKNKLPDAIELKIAFATVGGQISHGTALTMASKMGEGGAERRGGKIIKVPLGDKGMWLVLENKRLFFMQIPWGDVSTAYFTTGIPNIETYTGITPKLYKILKFQKAFNWLLRTSIIRNYINKQIKKREPGPSDEKREKAKTFVWAQVQNAKGEKATAYLKTPEGYTLTTHSTLLIAKKILEEKFLAGYQTPAIVYGADLIMEVPQVERKLV